MESRSQRPEVDLEAPVEAGAPRPTAAPTPTGGAQQCCPVGANGSQNFQVNGMSGEKGRGPRQSVLLLGVWELANELMGVKCVGSKLLGI